MQQVRLIRHGESAANAGDASHDHATIPLTATGVEQAHVVARSFKRAPALIVASPFSRAQVTAAATAMAFPSARLETWPVQEFTYLEPQRCRNTTVAQRRCWVDAYWLRSDPAYIDGIGAESFVAFVSRAQAFVDQLTEHAAHDIAVFSHGQFINAVAWLLEQKPQRIDRRAMMEWREYEIAHHVRNGCGYLLFKHPGSEAWTVGHPVNSIGELSAPGRCLPVEP